MTTTFVRETKREAERQPVMTEETWSAVEFLIRRRRSVRMISGFFVVDQMNHTAAHLRGLARQLGWVSPGHD